MHIHHCQKYKFTGMQFGLYSKKNAPKNTYLTSRKHWIHKKKVKIVTRSEGKVIHSHSAACIFNCLKQLNTSGPGIIFPYSKMKALFESYTHAHLQKRSKEAEQIQINWSPEATRFLKWMVKWGTSKTEVFGVRFPIIKYQLTSKVTRTQTFIKDKVSTQKRVHQL